MERSDIAGFAQVSTGLSDVQELIETATLLINVVVKSSMQATILMNIWFCITQHYTLCFQRTQND
jgi:hypothetical protein